MADIVTFTENTLFKVKEALEEVGLKDGEIVDAITAMQARGVLFCERVKPVGENAFIGVRVPSSRDDELVHAREIAHGLRSRHPAYDGTRDLGYSS